ncbi:hypothetical protein FPOAC1_003379 [Fusarium poae]|uniref:Uncharacterized protein n=1 Tax=Fusarium poae TaxID=36050 RepID=A0A1B8B981_FUSPO|nr:hypothetical protein FPOAC1_003379 [Fusarium poae]KAG8677363.1 hypothetical protein FPOAC1_003379 [Fusarium poae]OBS29277.1 hypothetical protein FPOA_03214 [Fusarium poae]
MYRMREVRAHSSGDLKTLTKAINESHSRFLPDSSCINHAKRSHTSGECNSHNFLYSTCGRKGHHLFNCTTTAESLRVQHSRYQAASAWRQAHLCRQTHPIGGAEGARSRPIGLLLQACSRLPRPLPKAKLPNLVTMASHGVGFAMFLTNVCRHHECGSETLVECISYIGDEGFEETKLAMDTSARSLTMKSFAINSLKHPEPPKTRLNREIVNLFPPFPIIHSAQP